MNRNIAIKTQIARMIAFIDRNLCRQISEILHHEDFKNLEASWRSLQNLVSYVSEIETKKGRIKVELLCVTLDELAKDFQRSLDYDDSNLFQKIYDNEFGMSGGEPFGLMIGNYCFTSGFSSSSRLSDMDILANISEVANASFCPFIAAADASLFGINDYSELKEYYNFDEILENKELLKFKNLREKSSSIFIGLTLPEVQVRKPYGAKLFRSSKFCFKEYLKGSTKDFLWGNGSFSFGKTIIRSFHESGWFNLIRGVWNPNFFKPEMAIDSLNNSYENNLLETHQSKVFISESLEQTLSNFGFIPLCTNKHRTGSTFHTCQSIKKIGFGRFKKKVADEKLSSMLQYVLCVSRFAHYIKVMIRDRIGKFTTAGECQLYLEEWLDHYIAANDNASLDLMAKRPIKEADVSVSERVDKPGAYYCVVNLRPHFHLANISSSMKIVTDLSFGKI